MSPPASTHSGLETKLFTKDTLIDGRPAQIECFALHGQTLTGSGSLLKVVSLEDEWYDDVSDPVAIVDALRRRDAPQADLFTFWQRVPDLEQKYPFYSEQEDLAVLPIDSFDHWWKAQIRPRVRTLI